MHPALDGLLTGRIPALMGTCAEKIVDRSPLGPHQKAIPKKVESEFFRRSVGDIRAVSLAAFVLIVVGEDDTDFQSECVVQGFHPLGVALG